MARESKTMRQKQRNGRRNFRDGLQKALSLVSHVAAIIGTIAAIIDLMHHW